MRNSYIVYYIKSYMYSCSIFCQLASWVSVEQYIHKCVQQNILRQFSRWWFDVWKENWCMSPFLLNFRYLGSRTTWVRNWKCCLNLIVPWWCSSLAASWPSQQKLPAIQRRRSYCFQLCSPWYYNNNNNTNNNNKFARNLSVDQQQHSHSWWSIAIMCLWALCRMFWGCFWNCAVILFRT